VKRHFEIHHTFDFLIRNARLADIHCVGLGEADVRLLGPSEYIGP
jgi:hypothetical protein